MGLLRLHKALILIPVIESKKEEERKEVGKGEP